MATVINNPGDNNGSGMGTIIGVILAIILLFVLIRYAIPAMRGNSGGTNVNVEVPDVTPAE